MRSASVRFVTSGFRLDVTEVQQVASLHLPVPALFRYSRASLKGREESHWFWACTRSCGRSAGTIHAFRLARLCQVLVVQRTTGNAHDDEEHLCRQCRDNRRTRLPRCTRSRSACPDRSLTLIRKTLLRQYSHPEESPRKKVMSQSRIDWDAPVGMPRSAGAPPQEGAPSGQDATYLGRWPAR